jgi:hypothetical protein
VEDSELVIYLSDLYAKMRQNLARGDADSRAAAARETDNAERGLYAQAVRVASVSQYTAAIEGFADVPALLAIGTDPSVAERQKAHWTNIVNNARRGLDVLHHHQPVDANTVAQKRRNSRGWI